MKSLFSRGARRRIASVALKEIRQLARDPLTAGFVVGVPLIQLVLFGYAINQDIRHVATAVVDHSNSAISRQMIGKLVATQTFEIAATVQSEKEGQQLLAAGTVQAVILVPPDFARRYFRGRGAQISILLNASDPTLARTVRSSARGLSDVLERRLQPFDLDESRSTLRAPRKRGRFGPEPRLIREFALEFPVLSYFNPELRTPVFVIPGLLGVILTTTMIMMTALALVREREKGSFEFLIATPVQRGELMVGKILPYIGIGLVQIFIILVSGMLFFRVPMQGSVIELSLASLIFIAANLTLGLVISTVTSTQLQATQLSFFFFLPSVLLSGFMFPFEAMPVPAQWMGELLPLTHYIRISRAVMLRGASVWTQWDDLLAMLVFFAIGLFAAANLFKKRLD